MSTTAIRAADHLFIGGEWVSPLGGGIVDVINPATEEPIAQAALGGPMDIDRAVRAAHGAFADSAGRSVAERAPLLRGAGEVPGARGGVRRRRCRGLRPPAHARGGLAAARRGRPDRGVQAVPRLAR